MIMITLCLLLQITTIMHASDRMQASSQKKLYSRKRHNSNNVKIQSEREHKNSNKRKNHSKEVGRHYAMRRSNGSRHHELSRRQDTELIAGLAYHNNKEQEEQNNQNTQEMIAELQNNQNNQNTTANTSH